MKSKPEFSNYANENYIKPFKERRKRMKTERLKKMVFSKLDKSCYLNCYRINISSHNIIWSNSVNALNNSMASINFVLVPQSAKKQSISSLTTCGMGLYFLGLTFIRTPQSC